MADVMCVALRPGRAAVRLALLMLLTAAFAGAHAKGLFEGDDEEEAPKVQTEVPVTLPAFPKPENLLPFDAGPTTAQKTAIDPKSLTVVPNEVRYTLVAASKSGAYNVSYEGLRCSTLEMRRYAFGHGDEKWAPARGDKWAPIQFNAANSPQATLALHYFCRDKEIEGTAKQIVDRFRYNRPLVEEKYRAN